MVEAEAQLKKVQQNVLLLQLNSRYAVGDDRYREFCAEHLETLVPLNDYIN